MVASILRIAVLIAVLIGSLVIPILIALERFVSSRISSFFFPSLDFWSEEGEKNEISALFGSTKLGVRSQSADYAPVNGRQTSARESLKLDEVLDYRQVNKELHCSSVASVAPNTTLLIGLHAERLLRV